ncbi:MAG: glycoside hydrolase family 97 protein [Muribaculum sp.]|nr:glycoside hydrolase family 97 protein [Muribaculaceae bacterium]MCM1081481.1 glycoside hydrolase family 97 protein [Muribaculum sp.]
MNKTVLFAALAVSCIAAQAKVVTITSPDGKIVVTTADNDAKITYSLNLGDSTIVEPSQIAMHFAGKNNATKIKKTQNLGKKAEHIKAPFYRQEAFDTEYNSQIISLDNGNQIEWRVFNDGAAYRFVTNSKNATDTVINETASFNLHGNPTTYLPYSTNSKNPLAMAFQNYYTVAPLSEAKSLPAFLPVTADMGNGVKVTLLESNLASYPGMFVTVDTVAYSLNGLFAQYPSKTECSKRRMQMHVTERNPYIAITKGARTYPWRIIAVTTDDRQMPTNNLVYALAEPSKIDDTSWIKPGKVAWDWWNDWNLTNVPFKAGINTETYKYYIDFASENGIEYVVLDEGWYNPGSGDMLTVIPEIDLPELIAYAKSKNVGIVLWTVFNVLDNQLEEACSKYSAMGVAGFKVDFLDRDDQTAVEMTERIAQAAARHKLFLDYHGIYKPVGLNRTYPNLLNYEGVFGLEEVKWTSRDTDFPLYDVTFPYIRMMSGQSDYTPGAMRNASKANWRAIYSQPMSMGTRAHQLSCYIIQDSPFTMLCDTPSAYRTQQDCVDFITSLPVTFSKTEILDGKIGEYIVTSRYNDGKWYVGGATNWDSRDLNLNFNFLPEEKQFKATMVCDGANADRSADDHVHKTLTVNSTTTLPIHMAKGGGFVMILEEKGK